MNGAFARYPWSTLTGLSEAHEIAAAGGNFTGPGPFRFVRRGDDTPLSDGVHMALAASGGPGLQSQWDIPIPIAAGARRPIRIHDSVGEGLELQLSGLPIRKKEEERENCPRERWLHWQTQRYSDLCDTKEFPENEGEAETRLGVRRNWSTVRAIWADTDEDRAEMSLVVALAKDRALRRALGTIGRNPRRMLLRSHEAVPIARIQEMDSRTLRAYSRAPGHTPAEKAGAKQELLAVVRRDTTNLIENQVALWVARRLAEMASAYCQRNRQYLRSERYTQVRSLLMAANEALRSPELQNISKNFHHPDSPTYCLQFDHRYRLVWKTYLRIRRQERAVDDAWRWQARLWGTTVRVLVSAALSEIKTHREFSISTPVFIKEATRGEWLGSLSTPGPFQTAVGALHVIDLRCPESLEYLDFLEVPREAMTSGAEMALVFPAQRRAILVWSLIEDPETGSGGLESLGDCLQQLHLSCGWVLEGWIIPANPENPPDIIDWEMKDDLSLIRIPTPVEHRWEEFKGLLQELIENESIT